MLFQHVQRPANFLPLAQQLGFRLLGRRSGLLAHRDQPGVHDTIGQGFYLAQLQRRLWILRQHRRRDVQQLQVGSNDRRVVPDIALVGDQRRNFTQRVVVRNAVFAVVGELIYKFKGDPLLQQDNGDFTYKRAGIAADKFH